MNKSSWNVLENKTLNDLSTQVQILILKFKIKSVKSSNLFFLFFVLQLVINPTLTKLLFPPNREQLSSKYLFHFQRRLLIFRVTLLYTCFHLISSEDVTQILLS